MFPFPHFLEWAIAWLAAHGLAAWEAAYRYAGPGIFERLTP